MVRIGQVWLNGGDKLTVISESDTEFIWQVDNLIHGYDKDKFHTALLELGWRLSEPNVEQILQRYDGEM